MMDDFAVKLGLAVWFGILTSISPCPLATNIAAMSYIGRRVDDPRKVLISGLLYSIGRALVYMVIAGLLVASILSAPKISFWLQKYMIRIMGPVLILTGMFLLGLIGRGIQIGGVSEAAAKKTERLGVWGAGLLGILFALSFCPTSAALFFGSLLPLAVDTGSGLLLPALYGLGTALPVVFFAFVIASGANRLGKAFEKVTQLELWARRVTGGLFIGIGIWFTLRYIFKLF
jgi:cytochrome c-type biogenesis protein